jgi:hypothetical protein
MVTFQVCQPTGWTGLVVAWAVVRSLPVFVVDGPSEFDYLGGTCLPSLAWVAIQVLRYVDTGGWLLCGLRRME